ncbi:hypothetical protein ABK040_008228 [Willaertia magna]
MTVLPHDFGVPATRKVNLEKLTPNQTSKEAVNTMKENLKEASKMRDIMIRSMTQKSHSIIVESIEKYLPYLTGIVFAIENDQLRNGKDNKDGIFFEWTSGLLGEENKTFSRSKKYFSSKIITFELIMVVYCYGYSLCNLASEKIKQTTNLHDNNSITEIYQDAAICLRKAAGVFTYLNQIGLLSYVSGNENTISNNEPSSPNIHSPTNSPSSSNQQQNIPSFVNLSKLSIPKSNFALLPELDLLCAKSLLEYSQSIAQVIAVHTAIATGKGAGMISKLSVSVFKLFDQTQQTLIQLDDKLKQNNKESISAFESMNSLIDPEYRLVCAQYRILYRGITLYYLALDANQNDGLSVGYIINANKQLEEMDVFDEVSRHNPFMNETRRIFTESKKLETIFEKENRLVFRENVPDLKELEIPQGIVVLKPVEFKLTTAVNL